MTNSDDLAPSGDTYDLLMEAAYHTLCDYGYGDFSLRKVAARAGKSRGLVHYHYDSKNDLLVSLLDYLINEFESKFNGSAEASPADQLDSLLKWIAFGPDVAGRDGTAYFTAIFELRAQAPYDATIRKRLTQNFETVRDRCVSILRAGIESGEFRPVDPNQTATFIVAAVDGARNTDLTLNTNETVEATLLAIERFIFDYLTSE